MATVLVDHEAVLLDLKATLSSKKSHGGDALLAEIARLEARHRCEEGLPEKALRLYGDELRHVLAPAATGSLEDPSDGNNDRAGLAPASHRSLKEHPHVHAVPVGSG